MRILFAGSPDIAVPSLTLLAKHHTVVGVLTNPPSAQGRGLSADSTPVAKEAKRLGLALLSPAKLGAQERENVANLKPDLLVVFAYGVIFGPKFMALFKHGGINAHPSLLPRWRGCAPIPFALLHGDTCTGISIQSIASKTDTGDILSSCSIQLDGTETCSSLSEWAAETGAELLLAAVNDIENGTAKAVPQNDAYATYCRSISKDDGLIDWNKPAIEICNKVRAFYPWPGVFTTFNGLRLSIQGAKAHMDENTDSKPGTVLYIDKLHGIMVQTSLGLLALQRLQLQGKKALDFRDFVNGARDLVGTVLGE